MTSRCTRAGRTPKESVIAVEVFGRGTDFDVSQDAAVRVYIHKLRRKLALGPANGVTLRTVYSLGYRLEVSGEATDNARFEGGGLGRVPFIAHAAEIGRA